MLGTTEKYAARLAIIVLCVAAFVCAVLTYIAVLNNKDGEMCAGPREIDGVQCGLVVSSAFEQFVTFFLLVGVPILLPLALYLVVQLVRSAWRRS